MNNAAYWAPVEELWRGRVGGHVRVLLEYRRPIDLGETVVLSHADDALWLAVDGDARAAAAILPP